MTDTLTDPNVNNTCTYPFGQDSGWTVSKKNKLTFANAIKMKMSVIFGVFHMLLGIINKGQNCVYFSDYTTLFTEVVTGVVILLSLFGFMDFVIIMKWFTQQDIDYPKAYEPPKSTLLQYQKSEKLLQASNITFSRQTEELNSRIPGIIQVMISMCLSPFTCKATDEKQLDLLTKDQGHNMCATEKVGTYLIICMVVCIPIFMCVKPCMMLCTEHPHEEHAENEMADFDALNVAPGI